MYPLIDSIYIQATAVALCLFAIALLLRKSIAFYKNALTAQSSLVDQINQLLPQTQCGQCSYKGCLPYARAIAQGHAINQCPPGGMETIRELAMLLNESPRLLNPAHGNITPFSIAAIREDECIGCTKCIQACPVDAILGGPKLMHTVIIRECTGCDLCVEPCPVDCIDMIASKEIETYRWQTADHRLAGFGL